MNELNCQSKFNSAMKRFFGFFIILFLYTIQTGAQESYQWQVLTSGGYTYKTVPADPMRARFYTLPNGLTVILSINRKEPKISALIAVRAGSKNDPSDHTGLAHYLEHLMFKGTDKYGTRDWAQEKPILDSIEELFEKFNQTRDSGQRAAIYHEIDQVSGRAAKFAIANEYDKMMTAMGGQGSNAFTSVEETVYTEDIPSSSIDRFLTLQAERFRYPVFRLFHTELEAVYEEKNRALDNDNTKVFEKLMATIFPTHHYGTQTTIGTIEHLKNPSLRAIGKYYDANYVPNNMAIILSGDFDPDYVIHQIDLRFGYMHPKDLVSYDPAPEQPIQAPIYREVLGPDAESVNIGFRLPGARDARATLIANALRSMLFNGKAGLIDLNLNKKQAVLNASSSLESFNDYSILFFSARNKSDQTLEQVRDLILDQIRKVKQGDFDETLIRATVDNEKFSLLEGLNDNSNRVSQLLDPFVVDKGKSWPDNVAQLQQMSKLTKKDIVDFANQWLGDNYVCIFKRKGEDKNVVKVVKPPITPVEVNRDAQSAFAVKVNSMPSNPVHPQWLDYSKDFKRDSIGHAELLYVQNTDNEIFRLRYRLDMGSYNSKTLGLAAAYLQYLGTPNMSAGDVSRQFYNLACNYNISVANEFTTISITGLQKNMTAAVRLFESLLTQCLPDDKALAELKARTVKARANNKLNKSAILTGLWYYAIYGPQNPYNNQLSQTELNALQAKDLVDLLHQLCKFRHTIIYFGPLTLERTADSIRSVHALPASFIANPAFIKYIKTDQTANKVLFADYDMVQAEISWIRNTSEYDPVHQTVIDVFNEYYGGGMGSVVFQTLRESKALAYGTYTYYQVPSKKNDRSVLIAYIGCQADKLDESISGMNELLSSIPESDKLLEISKQSIRSNLETERFTEDAVINQYLTDKRRGLDRDIRRDVYENFEKVGFEDLHEFARKNFAGKPFTYCIVASEKKVPPAELSRYGEVKKLPLEEIFGY
jgi:predicted Zn-dependent peptidase